MELDDFTEVLDNYGIGFYESGRSLAVEYCPECERTKYKVIFRVVDVDEDQPFFGRCQSGSCRQNYSSASYLFKIGVPAGEVAAAHGKNPEEMINRLSPEFDVTKPIQKEKVVGEVDTDISKFFHVEDFVKHPAAQYAIKRGYARRLRDMIMIDPSNSAVVFLVRDSSGKVVGYQKRYSTVVNDGPKTKTADNFQVSENIMRFHNDGPIAICEGPFTALSAFRWGFDAICTMGSGIGQNQLSLIENAVGDKDILVALENDDAGKKYYQKIAVYFGHRNKDIKVILPQSGSDLNDSWQNGDGYTIEDGVEVNPALPNVVELW